MFQNDGSFLATTVDHIFITDCLPAAARAETCMAVSCVGSTRLEDVTSAAPSLLKWMLLYIFSSQELTKTLVNRAEKEGYK